jgi:hypothetical protein
MIIKLSVTLSVHNNYDNKTFCYYTSCAPALFAESHMDFEVHRNDSEQPSITEMTEKAIQILSKNPKGFFLFVEGMSTVIVDIGVVVIVVGDGGGG